MKKSIMKGSIAFFVVLSLFLAFSAPAVFARTKIIKLVVPSPVGDYPLTWINDQIAERFNKRVEGYRIDVHAGGALAQLPEYFDAVRVGAVEMACAPWGFYTFMEPKLGLIEAPFLINNNDAGAWMAEMVLPMYDEILQKKFNAKGLGLMNLAGVELFSSKPVQTLEDWDGLLLGALSPMVAAMIKDLGGSPMTIMWTDMYESLQKKIIDSTTGGTHSAVQMGFIDVVKNATLFYGIASWNGFTINKKVWEKMPADVQNVLQEEVTWAVNEMHKIMKTLDAEDLKVFKNKGVAVYKISASERERWIAATADTRNKALDGQGEFGVKIRALAERANKIYPYESKY